MTYSSPYKIFYFESYEFDAASRKATFRYNFDKQRFFKEVITFTSAEKNVNQKLLDKALQLAHVLLGLSYYKTFPTKEVQIDSFKVSDHQAAFFSEVYKDGLSQYVFENRFSPDDIARFKATNGNSSKVEYEGSGIAVMQSGGKDSLLLAELLKRNRHEYTTVYIGTSSVHPKVIDTIDAKAHRDIYRQIDKKALAQAKDDGGLNGHVPITVKFVSLSLVDMVLHNESTLLLAIGQEGEEPYSMIGDYAIRHQWSKIWRTEQLLAEYVATEFSPQIKIGSPLRNFTELKVAELFSKYCWQQYTGKFSSCNLGNYIQGQANEDLVWCGKCAKCANSFLLFAPFVAPHDLQFNFGKNLLKDTELIDIFKGLLDVDSVIKPFECVGETDELRLAYYLAQERFPAADYKLPFAVPLSKFNYERTGPIQSWAQAMIQ